MADFDQFEGAQQEEDPAADFLAREQDQMAGLEDNDFGFPDHQQPPPMNDEELQEAPTFGGETSLQLQLVTARPRTLGLCAGTGGWRGLLVGKRVQ